MSVARQFGIDRGAHAGNTCNGAIVRGVTVGANRSRLRARKVGKTDTATGGRVGANRKHGRDGVAVLTRQNDRRDRSGGVRDGVRDQIKRNGRAGCTARDIPAGDRFKRPNVRYATSVQRTGVGMVAALKNNDRRGLPSVGGVGDRVTNAADGLGKTARGVGVRNVAGALR